MKLKKWLISSYIVTMILPIIIGVFIYQGIRSCSEKFELEYYLNSLGIASKYENRLENPSIYEKVDKKLSLVDEEDKDSIKVEIYNKYGILIYASTGMGQSSMISVAPEELYKNLYTVKRGYKYNTIKKPVFKKGDIIGFYEIKIFKDNLVKDIKHVNFLAIGVFIVVLIVIFIFAIYFLNRKILNPITMLINDMKDYSGGEKETSFKYNKNDEIGDLISHFNNLKEEINISQKKIQKQHKDKEYLIAAISHDLKTPLTSIRAYSEAIYEYKNLDLNRAREYSSIIINKSDYMKKMLEDLLTYTLLTTKEKLNFVEVEGEEFLEMLFYGYDKICDKNNIELVKSINVSENYKVDVNLMIRVIDNLVSNAIRYTEKGGRIYLEAYSEEAKLPDSFGNEIIKEINELRKDSMFIFVKNDGEPIPKEEQEKIFNDFYQADSSRNKSLNGGTGLGLSIVKIIIDKHQGSVKVISKENFGTLIGCFIKRIN